VQVARGGVGAAAVAAAASQILRITFTSPLLMAFQIRAKVNQDPIETEPGACATFESEQVSPDFLSS